MWLPFDPAAHPPRQQGAILGAVAEDAELAHAEGEDLARRSEQRRVQLAARSRLHTQPAQPAQRGGRQAEPCAAIAELAEAATPKDHHVRRAVRVHIGQCHAALWR